MNRKSNHQRSPSQSLSGGLRRLPLWLFGFLCLMAGGCGAPKDPPPEDPITNRSPESVTPDSHSEQPSTVETTKPENKSDSDLSSPNSPAKEAPTAQSKPAPPQPPVNKTEFHAGLAQAAKDYLKFAMVNSVVMEAPADCRPPTEEPHPKMSQSDQDSSHGRKLYFLFAKDITHYLNPENTPAPTGQILVKESWTAKKAHPDARNLRNHASGMRINPRAKIGDQNLEIGKRSNLFVMMKLDADTPETDQGWVYGVVDPTTFESIAAGAVDSCMQCHESANNDRLFGASFDFDQPLNSPVDPTN